ncbi:AraC family transcriptional regulator [Paractinoplanes maris]|uniref:AraC family transcriptional regulator n=1 Tax=Paractinoplanes maris TaxID=1734446 RepID=UPI002020ABB2|nr:AraC family transcriptional regulator [Actinoplanes maris]
MRPEQDAPNPVSRFEFATHEAEVAHDVLHRLYDGGQFRMLRAGHPFTYRQEAVAAGPITAVRVLYTMDVSVRFEPSDSLIFTALTGGRVETEHSHGLTRTGPGDVLVHLPGRALTNICRDFDMVSLHLDPALVTGMAVARTGLPWADFRFEAMTPVSAALGRYWRDTLTYVHQLLTGPPEPLDQPLAIIAAAELAATAALVTFPNSAMTAPERPAIGPVPPAAVRRAVSYIDSHAGDPITAAWIAEAARVGPRALQAAFRRHLDTTPMAYLRRVRLSRAHRDLLDADPTTGDTVASIARRWGYLSLSHFAADYRSAYGRPPSDTLRY